MPKDPEMLHFSLSPTSYAIMRAVESTVKNFSHKANSPSSSINDLEEIAFKQEIEARVLKEQARIEQELAIARRIDNAEEVEIEEFYDTSEDGTLGLKYDENGIIIGASGSGKKVSKRVYKFKGYRTIISDSKI